MSDKIDINFNLAKQQSYDTYNDFMFDSNHTIFYKMATRMRFFDMIKNVPGDIVECGVFKGAGLALWLKMLLLHSPHDARKVVGFDFFNESECISSLDDNIDNTNMQKIFKRCDVDNLSIDSINNTLLNAGFPLHKFKLVKGDVSITAQEYADNNPGFRISLLYMDVDVDKPTYDTLCALWDRVCVGGVIVLDEYGIEIWSESNGVDRFIKERGLTLYKTNVQAPSAYIIKC